MRVLIAGGDGYLGWPTAMYLSKRGHEVAVADNYLRRRLSREEDAEPLFPVPNLHERTRLWREKTGRNIEVFVGDLSAWEFIDELFNRFVPDVIVHYAEQPSAPYSMAHRKGAALTLQNNLMVTFNLVYAVRTYCPEAHMIKLGTMGEYGTPDIDIEEGWITINHKGRSDRFLFPRQAGSLYHTTKIMDTDMLWFYVRTWGLRVTDLMQGPVYGLLTDETGGDIRLFPFFNYDEIFGTVLNRFIVQAVCGYPLTVYGKGGQTRGYLNIKDTLECVRLSLENPPEMGELRIFNQFTETFTVNELARMVADSAKMLGLSVSVKHVENPRKESEDHYYNPVHTGLVELGLKPHLLGEDVLVEMMEWVLRFKDSIQKHRIFSGVKWD